MVVEKMSNQFDVSGLSRLRAEFACVPGSLPDIQLNPQQAKWQLEAPMSMWTCGFVILSGSVSAMNW